MSAVSPLRRLLAAHEPQPVAVKRDSLPDSLREQLEKGRQARAARAEQVQVKRRLEWAAGEAHWEALVKCARAHFLTLHDYADWTRPADFAATAAGHLARYHVPEVGTLAVRYKHDQDGWRLDAFRDRLTQTPFLFAAPTFHAAEGRVLETAEENWEPCPTLGEVLACAEEQRQRYDELLRQIPCGEEPYATLRGQAATALRGSLLGVLSSLEEWVDDKIAEAL